MTEPEVSLPQVERLMILIPSIALAALSPLAALTDLRGDVPVTLGIALFVGLTAWFGGLFVLNEWVIGRGVDRALVGAGLAVLVGNLFEGLGEQAGLKVGSSSSLFLIGALVLINVRRGPRWKTFQNGLLLLWSAVTAEIVYSIMSQIFDDVVTRLDEGVVITAVPGILLITVATATRRTLARPTRALSLVGMVGIVAAVPVLFIGEFWTIVAATGFVSVCIGFSYEALTRSGVPPAEPMTL
jgi:hypothetical protein